MPLIHLSCFRVDITPPYGHPLCAGMVLPVKGVSDSLFARGIILLSETELPIVICAVDWCEIRNDDYYFWREQIAQAVQTSPDRVVVQCVHQHNAPIVDTNMQELITKLPGNFSIMDITWCQEAAQRTAQAARESLCSTNTITHVGIGKAKVQDIASNRRIMNAEGKVENVRWSACPDSNLRAAPEGIIDPMLKTVSFWQHSKKLTSLHHYATHPMSYYGDGIVTSDFTGNAREKCAEIDGVPHLYFTGCAGDITAGKYNDGSPESRANLTERLYSAILESEGQVELLPLEEIHWQSQVIQFPENSIRSADMLQAILNDASKTDGERIGAALELAFKQRLSLHPKISISCLALGESIRMLYLPGEPFIDYQLFAQRIVPDLFVAVSGYGDGGPGYIPLARSYPEGGYEPTGAFVGPDSEILLKEAIRSLLNS